MAVLEVLPILNVLREDAVKYSLLLLVIFSPISLDVLTGLVGLQRYKFRLSIVLWSFWEYIYYCPIRKNQYREESNHVGRYKV
jgi:hypothetical protein